MDLDTAIAETVYHRTRELEEIGVFDARVEMRQYLADFDCELHVARDSRQLDSGEFAQRAGAAATAGCRD